MPRYLLIECCLLILMLGACDGVGGVSDPNCSSSGFVLAPTATRPADPDLSLPPQTPTGGDSAVYCPTLASTETPPAEYPTHFVASDVTNLTLDRASQELAALAVGDDRVAIAWLSEGDIYVALSRGGSHFQTRRLDSGASASLAFSPANRLHVAYEQDGRIFYRAADQGAHPAESPTVYVDEGQDPQIVVDEMNWAHILYERNGPIYKARHLSGENWLVEYVTAGSTPHAITFANEWAEVYGIPAGQYWFGIWLTVIHNGQIHLLRFLSWFNLWQEVAVFAPPPGATLPSSGAPGLDYLAVSSDQAWVVAAWVTHQANPGEPGSPLYGLPIIEPANPLYPAAIANPHHLFAGLNAVRLRTEGTPFAAGLKQTMAVPDPAGFVAVSAWGLIEAPAGADVSLRLGLDPTGGDSPNSPQVIWTAPVQPEPGSFTQFAVSAPAHGETATIFLHATSNPGYTGIAVWDAAEVENGLLLNASFEGPFVAQSSLTVPENWTAYYEDSGQSAISGRDAYTVYAAWSNDGGLSWSLPTVVVQNRSAGGLTGAIRPAVFPLITTATETPSITFFYIYESGDPGPGNAGALRFGRLYAAQCDLGTAECQDAPGAPLLPHNAIRPALELRLARDRFHPDRAVLAWDSLQTDYASRDVYATTAALR